MWIVYLFFTESSSLTRITHLPTKPTQITTQLVIKPTPHQETPPPKVSLHSSTEQRTTPDIIRSILSSTTTPNNVSPTSSTTDRNHIISSSVSLPSTSATVAPTSFVKEKMKKIAHNMLDEVEEYLVRFDEVKGEL